MLKVSQVAICSLLSQHVLSSDPSPPSPPATRLSLLHQRQLDDSLKLLFLLPPPEVRLLLLPGRDLHGDAQLLVIGAAGRLLFRGGGAEAGSGAGLVLRRPGQHGGNSGSTYGDIF